MRRIIGLPLLIGVLAIAGCTASANAPAPTTPVAAPTSQAPLPVPSSEPGQLAIATFDNTGTVAQSNSISGPALTEGTFRIEGECRGESFDFRLRDATVGAPERVIMSGEITCSDSSNMSSFRYDFGMLGGPVQMVIVDADTATEGWVRAVRAE